MKQANVINIDDPAGKTVGRRRRPINPLATADGLQEFTNEQFKESGHRLTPGGVFRFDSQNHGLSHDSTDFAAGIMPNSSGTGSM